MLFAFGTFRAIMQVEAQLQSKSKSRVESRGRAVAFRPGVPEGAKQLSTDHGPVSFSWTAYGLYLLIFRVLQYLLYARLVAFLTSQTLCT